MIRSQILTESWDQFRRRMPRDAVMLLERLAGGAVRSEGPSNMLTEVEPDGGRARAQIAAKRAQHAQMLPSFETALSNRGDTAAVIGRVMSVGDHSGWSPRGVAEDAEPQLLTEG